MWNTRWLLALPLICAAMLAPARAATIRDTAGMFDTNAVREAQNRLERIESQYKLPVTIETIESLEGQNIDAVLKEHALTQRAEGLYILISKDDHKIQADASGPYQRAFPASRLKRIWTPITEKFRATHDFNGGLLAGVDAIRTESASALAELGTLKQGGVPHRGVAPLRQRGRPAAGQGTFGIGTLLGIGLLIVAVLIGIRLLGALFGGGHAGPGRMGGPGYGGAGYGGGGGGFFSSLLGGLGDAVAGNWLYDQFSGRHHQGDYADNSAGTSDTGAAPEPDNNDWSGGGGDWGGDGGGGGGGDWGGGGGGGGDW